MPPAASTNFAAADTTMTTTTPPLASPSSYMVRTRLENRPWTGEEEDDDIQHLNRYQATAKKTNIQAQFQFQQRVAAKKAAYRAVLSGEREESSGSLKVAQDEEEAERLSQVLSDTTEGGPDPDNTTSINAEAARLARAKRMATATPYHNNTNTNNSPSPTSVSTSFFSGKTAQEKEVSDKVKQARAQRLRTSLKQSSEDLLLQESLQERRARLAEEERLAEIEKRILKEKELQDQERREREAKQLAAQQAHETEQALAKERLRLDQIRQNYREHNHANVSPTNRLDGQVDPIIPMRSSPRRKMKRRHSDSDMQVQEPTLMEELQELLRDTGIFKTCVSSCFGEEDLAVDNSVIKAGRSRRKTRANTSNERRAGLAEF
jgi:hypothetical protein